MYKNLICWKDKYRSPLWNFSFTWWNVLSAGVNFKQMPWQQKQRAFPACCNGHFIYHLLQACLIYWWSKSLWPDWTGGVSELPCMSSWTVCSTKVGGVDIVVTALWQSFYQTLYVIEGVREILQRKQRY